MAGGRLQHELRKRRPFDSLEQGAVLNVARSADRFGLRFARLFKEYGLMPSQCNVQRILRGNGKPLPILEVAERLVAAVPGHHRPDRPSGGHELPTGRRCTEDRRVPSSKIFF